MPRKGDTEIKRTLDRLRVLANNPVRLNKIIDEAEAMLLAKGDDYSGDEDTFQNFRNIAAMSGMHVYRVFITMISVKLGRLFTLAKRDYQAPAGYIEPQFEAAVDSVRDLLGYLVLWIAFISFDRLERTRAIHPDTTD